MTQLRKHSNDSNENCKEIEDADSILEVVDCITE